MRKLLILLLITTNLVIAPCHAGLSTQNREKNVVVDGNMELSDTSAWTSVIGAPLTKIAYVSGDEKLALRVTRVATSWSGAQQTCLTAGKTYRATGIAWGSASRPILRLPTEGITLWTGVSSASAQPFDVTFSTVTDTILRLTMSGGTEGDSVYFDKMFITEVKGKTLNGEKNALLDFDMEKSVTTDWTATDGASLSKTSGMVFDGKLVLRITDAGGGGAKQDVLTIGKTYKLDYRARTDGTAGSAPGIKNGSTWLFTGTASTVWQKPTTPVIFTATATNLELYKYALAGAWVEFDNIFITEYKGTFKNTYKNILADPDCEKSGVTSWTAYRGATLEKLAGRVNNGDGRQILRATYGGQTTFGARVGGLVVGKKYRVQCWARGTATPGVMDGNVVFCTAPITSATVWSWIEGTKVATTAYLYFYSDGSSGYIEYDNLMVTQVD